jgi:hypothetical protein
MADAKMTKQVKFVEGRLVQWKSLLGTNPYTWADFQASFLSALLRSKHTDLCPPIEDIDPLSLAMIAPTISSLMPSPTYKAEFTNAARAMKTWGELKAYFEHGAKRSIGEFTAAAKQLFHPIDDPILSKDSSIAGTLAEIRKTLLRLGINYGAPCKLRADSNPEDVSHFYNGKLVENQTAAELKTSLKLALSSIAKAENQAATAFDTIQLLFGMHATLLRG